MSAVGGGLARYAVPLQVFELARSSLAVGLAGLFMMVPTLAAGLLGGPLTDALDRRRLTVVTSSALAVVSLAMAALAFASASAPRAALPAGAVVWALYGLVAVQSGLVAVDQPARSTFSPAAWPAW